MALDTKAKRAAAIHHGSPWRGILPPPDGAVTAPDRQTVAFMSATPAAGGGGADVADSSFFLVM